MRFVLIIHESVCGSPASLSKNFLAFAGTPQMPRKTFWRLQKSCKLRFLLFGLCRSPASSVFPFWVFAEVLQAPISPFGHLQKFCNLHFLLFGVCRSSASSIFLFWAFAEVLQAPFFPFGHLQKFCKLHFSLWGLCRNAANVFGRLTRGFIPPSAARRNTRNGRSRAPSAGCVAPAAVGPSGAARRAWRRPIRRPRCQSRAG